MYTGGTNVGLQCEYMKQSLLLLLFIIVVLFPIRVTIKPTFAPLCIYE